MTIDDDTVVGILGPSCGTCDLGDGREVYLSDLTPEFRALIRKGLAAEKLAEEARIVTEHSYGVTDLEMALFAFEAATKEDSK